MRVQPDADPYWPVPRMALDKRFSMVLEVIIARRTGQQTLMPVTISGFYVKESITWSLNRARPSMVVPHMVALILMRMW